MRIGLAVPSEVESIKQHACQAMEEGTLYRTRRLSEERVQDLTEKVLERGGEHWVATEGEELLGWILIGPHGIFFPMKRLDLYMNCMCFPTTGGKAWEKN